MVRRDWSEEETMMAFALYMILPQKEYRSSNPNVQSLAAALGRTPDAVKMKIENLKRGDPNRIALGQAGLPNGAGIELEIWKRFTEEGNSYLEKAVSVLWSNLEGRAISSDVRFAIVDIPPAGEIRFAERAERVNQYYFRNSLLRNYRGKCCLTGLAVPSLLVASHIKPWADSDPKTERLAASNGLLLNALHDRAFDKGLMTLNSNLEVVLSSTLNRNDAANDLLFRFEGQKISSPIAMPPAREFIEYHNDVIFIA